MMIANRYTIPLSKEKELELMHKAQAGDKKAADRVVLANYRFMVTVALGYRNRGLDNADLISEGFIGLQRAVKTYNVASGLKFISYAVWWIRAYVRRAIIEHGGIVRVPSNLHHRQKGKTEEEQAEFDKIYKRNREMISAIRSSPSMDAMLAAGIEFTHPSPAPDILVENKMHQRMLDDILAGLKPREVEVIRARFGVDTGTEQTLQEIADTMNVSRERVRQIEEKAMKKLTNKATLIQHYRGKLLF